MTTIKVRPSRAMFVIAIAGLLSLSLGLAANAQPEPTGYDMEFADGIKHFCGDGDDFVVGAGSLPEEGGFKSPDEAIKDFVSFKQRHSDTGIRLSAGMASVDGGSYQYFDTGDGDALTSRLVAEKLADGSWVVSQAFICADELGETS